MTTRNPAHKILVLDAANQNTLAIVRHLSRAGYIVHVCGYQQASLALFSKYPKKKFVIPAPDKSEEGFINALVKILTGEKYNLLMPVGFKSYKACTNHQEKLKALTNLIVTTQSNIALAADKRATYNLAQQTGVPYPKTIRLHSRSEIHTLETSYPAVVKSPFESGQNVVEYADNKQQLIEKFEAMCAKNKFEFPNLPIIQEYVQGEGYGFFAYYEEGKCRSIFMHHRLREYPVTGGASVCAEAYRDEKLKLYGMKLLDELKWNGVAMVEFKKDIANGEYKLMEINPKFWGSLELALSSGVNFPDMLIRKAAGEEIAYNESYEKVTFQWLLNGELLHVIERPSDFFGVIKTLFYSKTDLCFRDPVPHLFQIANIFTHYYKKLKGL